MGAKAGAYVDSRHSRESPRGLSKEPGGHPRSGAGPVAVAAVLLTMVSASVGPFLVGSISVQIGRDISFTPADVGLAVAGYYLVSAVLSPFAGRFVAALGPATSLRLASAGSTVGLVMIALAPSSEWILVALTLLGMPNSLVQPSSNQVLSQVADPRLRGLSFGLVQAAIPVSTLLSGMLLAMVGDSSSWRPALWAVAVLTLSGQLLIGRVAVSTPVSAQSRTQTAPRRLTGGPPLMVAMVVGALLASAAATSLPSFVAVTGEQHEFSPTVIATAQVTGSLACITVRILAAWRGGMARGPGMLGTVATLLLVGSGGYLLLAWSGTPWAFALGVTVAYAFGWGWNGLFNLSVSRVRPTRIAASTGMTQGGVYLGGMCGPPLFAAVVARNGYGPGWLVIAIGALASSLAIAYATRRWLTQGEREHERVGQPG